jgi:hypothetical protein
MHDHHVFFHSALDHWGEANSAKEELLDIDQSCICSLGLFDGWSLQLSLDDTSWFITAPSWMIVEPLFRPWLGELCLEKAYFLDDEHILHSLLGRGNNDKSLRTFTYFKVGLNKIALLIHNLLLLRLYCPRHLARLVRFWNRSLHSFELDPNLGINLSFIFKINKVIGIEVLSVWAQLLVLD